MTSQDAAVEHRGLSDAEIDAMRAFVGQPVVIEQFNHQAGHDVVNHYAYGIGDTNPLWLDGEYGRGTRWHGQIAPPTFAIATGLDQTPKFTDPERKKLFRGLFRGTGKYYSGVKWTWYQPIYAGRPVLMEAYTLDVQVKESEFSGGRSVKETYRFLYVDADGNPIATRDESYINAERHGSKKSAKLAGIERQHWTEEEFAEVEAAYEGEIMDVYFTEFVMQ